MSSKTDSVRDAKQSGNRHRLGRSDPRLPANRQAFGGGAMPKPTPVQFLLRMYKRGGMADHEAVGQVIDLAGESDPSELVSQLPPDLLAKVRRKLDEAPTTDEGWDKTLFIFGGSYGRDFDPEAAQSRWRSIYRAGVEALRSYFAREAPGI
ncbi:MAG: hypothetical protein U0800_05895 [Isosphaeraceae bacterium]